LAGSAGRDALQQASGQRRLAVLAGHRVAFLFCHVATGNLIVDYTFFVNEHAGYLLDRSGVWTFEA
jgi:hypothetical protein